jgi:DNA-binding CsgD family transcriptional regulator
VAGRSVIDPKVVEELVNRSGRLRASPLHELSRREIEVLGEMAQGKTNAAIGATLHLSESAVEKYVSAIFLELGLTEENHLHRRVGAVLASPATKLPSVTRDAIRQRLLRGATRPMGATGFRQGGGNRPLLQSCGRPDIGSYRLIAMTNFCTGHPTCWKRALTCAPVGVIPGLSKAESCRPFGAH